MSICLLVMTDGRRELIAQSIPSLLSNVRGPFTRFIIHDDSGDATYRVWLAEQFPGFEIIGGDRLGFAGAYARAWRHLIAFVPEPYVLSTEDDFIYTRPVDLTDLACVLHQNPHLAQLALRRQPWGPKEEAAGGVVEQHPDAYAEMVDHAHRHWLEHRLFWTTNPSLHRTMLCALGWPEVAQSEGIFTHRLLEDPDLRFGYWGPRESGEWVKHIGHQRAGTGY